MPTVDPVPRDATADARSWPRWSARVAIVAPFAAVLLMAVGRQVQGEEATATAAAIELAASIASALLVAAGFGLGIAGLIGGRRRGSRDTMLMAGIGLFLCGGFLLLTVFASVLVAVLKASV